LISSETLRPTSQGIDIRVTCVPRSNARVSFSNQAALRTMSLH